MADAEDNTFIDGCGVFHDTPIGEGTRIRFKLNDDRQQDISVFVENGVLHVFGMYRPLLLGLTKNNNYISIDTKVWPKRE